MADEALFYMVVVGLLWPWLSKLGLGRLAGDIAIERGNVTCAAHTITRPDDGHRRALRQLFASDDGAISSPPAPYHLSAGGKWIRTFGSASREALPVG